MPISKIENWIKLLIGGYVFIILPINMLGHILELPLLSNLSKPFFMAILMIIVNWGLSKSTLKIWLLGALFFSWIGDIALMFDDLIPALFMVGLGGFMTAHIFYIKLFVTKSRSVPLNISLIERVIISFMLVYTVVLVAILWPHLGGLRIPVVIYALVLFLMGVTSAVRPKGNSYNYVFIGAILFIISDSILAINKFISPVWMSGVWIMSTYTLAQLLIVLGLKKYAANAGY